MNSRGHILLVLCIVVLTGYFILQSEGFLQLEAFQSASTFEVVISRYAEDLGWIQDIPEFKTVPVIVYNKGDPLGPLPENVKVLQLPNLGREGHTYLHHIVTNYTRLPDSILFLPGSAAKNKNKMLDAVLSIKRDPSLPDSFVIGLDSMENLDSERDFSIDEYECTNKQNREKGCGKQITSTPIRPFGAWVDHHMKHEYISCTTRGGILLTRRQEIHKRSRDFYRTLLSELSSSSNPESGHFLERAWHLIFSMGPEACSGTVYQ